MTDCNVLLGRIQPEFFPAVFGDGGDLPLDASAVASAFRDARRGYRERDRCAADAAWESPRAASGSRSRTWRTRSRRFRCSAATTSRSTRCLASAARPDSTRAWSRMRWACRRCFMHPLAGVLSAYGIGLADVTVMKQRAIEAVLDERALRIWRRRSPTLVSEARDALHCARRGGGGHLDRAPGRVEV